MSPKSTKQPRDDADALPEFEHPPLAEVVLGMQFDPLVGMTAAHMGTIWALFRESFPRTEDRAPLAATFERFGTAAQATATQWTLDLVARPALPRCWFVNTEGDQLLQLQQDRFVHNWRKVEAQARYPRYKTLRPLFASEAQALERYVNESRIGELRPNQCELTYVNHIVADRVWSEHHEGNRVFRMLSDSAVQSGGAHPQHIRLDTAFVMEERAGEPLGRLHVSIVSGVLSEDGRPMFAMTLTARGAPMGSGLQGVAAFLDLGHRSIVRAFAHLTTSTMHAAWGRKA